MGKTCKLVALAMLAALGLAVSAYGKPQRWRWPVITTTTATTATAATVVTPPMTTATVTTPTTAPPASASVTITAPPAYSVYTRGGTALVSGVVRATPGQTVTCVVDWGEPATSSATAATETLPGVYVCCPLGHVFVTSGPHTITLTAYVDGVAVGAAARPVTVF